MNKIRVCVRAIPGDLSKGIHRVAYALARYAPDWVEIVDSHLKADVWVLHVIGHGSMTEAQKHIDSGRTLAMIQYCLMTTEDSRPEAWMSWWRQSKLVMTYYDLPKFVAQHGTFDEARHFGAHIVDHVMMTPLGCDASVFRPGRPLRKPYLIGTSGTIAETEGAIECHDACTRLDRRQFHLGPQMPFGDSGAAVAFMQNCPDTQLAEFWSQCSYVAGLRRIEGFELPAIEGLLSGARPIMFDAPHYTRWFGEHAEYVTESSPDEVTDQLTEIMRGRVRMVTEQERAKVSMMFDWQTIATEFWERLR